jgi:osmotically-inducible protein OsmY
MSKHVATGKKTIRLMGLSLCIIALPLLAGVSGCTTTRYTQNTLEQNDDDATSYRIKKVLSEDPQHQDYAGVNVETFKRVVQLSGFVDTQEIKSRVGNLAGIEAGTRDVRNNITVKE